MAHKHAQSQWRRYLLRRLDNLRGFASGWGRSYGDIVNRARQIHSMMVTNAATFPTPPVTMGNFLTDIDNLSLYAGSYKGNLGGASATLLKHADAEAVINDLASLGSYVETVARTSGGSMSDQYVVLNQSGFPLRKRGRVNLASPWSSVVIPGPPTNLRQMKLPNGAAYAEYRLRWKKVKGAVSYVVWLKNIGGPDTFLTNSTKTFFRSVADTRGASFQIYVQSIGASESSAPSQVLTVVVF